MENISINPLLFLTFLILLISIWWYYLIFLFFVHLLFFFLLILFVNLLAFPLFIHSFIIPFFIVAFISFFLAKLFNLFLLILADLLQSVNFIIKLIKSFYQVYYAVWIINTWSNCLNNVIRVVVSRFDDGLPRVIIRNVSKFFKFKCHNCWIILIKF